MNIEWIKIKITKIDEKREGEKGFGKDGSGKSGFLLEAVSMECIKSTQCISENNSKSVLREIYFKNGKILYLMDIVCIRHNVFFKSS